MFEDFIGDSPVNCSSLLVSKTSSGVGEIAAEARNRAVAGGNECGSSLIAAGATLV